jgi:hypothetical protein
MGAARIAGDSSPVTPNSLDRTLRVSTLSVEISKSFCPQESHRRMISAGHWSLLADPAERTANSRDDQAM